MDTTQLFVEERQSQIVEFVEANKKATVNQLCEHFCVSSATIRNDLRDLESAHLILRTHGGAMMKRTGLDLNSSQKEVHNLEAKNKVARKALDLIEDGDTIVLDTGTTTLELARILGEKNDITVVTNDLAIALALEDTSGVNIVLMGGIVRKGFHCAVSIGEGSSQILNGLTVDKAIMGVNGLSISHGATTPDINTANTKKLMIAIASSVIVLCDSTKLEHYSFAQFASLDEIDVVVTDSCPEGTRRKLAAHGVEIIT